MLHVAVIGQGVLGSCIAVELALSSPNVKVYAFDSYKPAARCRQDAIAHAAPHGERAVGLVEAIQFCASLVEAARSATVVCEAIPENLEGKQALFRELETLCASTTTFTTNTLTLRLDEISATMRQPARLVGLRFLFPVLFIPFVELSTSSWVQGNRDVAAALQAQLQDVLHKIVFTFDVGSALEGETEADFLARARGFHMESLATRRDLMERAGLLRYRLDPETARRHADREKRLRWSTGDERVEEPLCVVCFDAAPQVVLLECGHVVLCRACAQQIMLTSRSCPVCRRAMQSGAQALWR